MSSTLACRAFLVACVMTFLIAAGRVQAGVTFTTGWNSYDGDGDGVPNVLDNAPLDFNPSQMDSDNDQLGDIADPYPFSTNGDGDPQIDSYDVDPTNPSVWDSTLSFSGPATASYLASLTINFTIAPSVNNYDEFTIKLDTNPTPVAHWFGTTLDTSLQFSAVDLANLGITSPGVHTFYYQDRYNGTGSVEVAFVPEPATLWLAVFAGGGLVATIARRRRSA